MKIGMIYQPCGLGDILFLQKLAHHMKDQGYEVQWPVVCEFEWLNQYIPDFNFVSWGDTEVKLTRPPLPDHVVFPGKEHYSPDKQTEITDEMFYFQGFGNHQPCMAGKYNSIGMDWGDYRNYIKFTRNKEKEDYLFYDVLGLRDDETFVFVNKTYCTRPHVMSFPRISSNPEDYGCKVVELQILEGFSMFDWCKVLEKCAGINMIETSLNYLLESPALFDTVKNKQLYLHHRYGSFHEVDYLFNLPWNYIR